jgi:hypothetical protein
LPGRAQEERLADAFLEERYALADDGLGESQALRGAGERAGLDHPREAQQRRKIIEQRVSHGAMVSRLFSVENAAMA